MSHPIDASPGRAPLEDGHFTGHELRQALTDGLNDVQRLRAIVHFGRMRCGVCWRLIEELAAGEPPGPPADFEPVVAALRRLIVADRRPKTIDQLRPVHGDCLDRCRRGRSRRDRPGPNDLSFFALLLEESREHSLGQPMTGLAVARATLELIENLPFHDLDRPWIDLEARARAYLGDEHRAAGHHRRAFEHLAAAKKELPRGTGDPELAATWHELRAELVLADQPSVAIELLEQALELLRPVKIEGRAAPTWVLLGLARLKNRHGRRAVDAWQRALSALPPGKNLRLRLRTLQLLASVAVKTRRFDDAREHLAEAVALEAGHTTLLLQAERLLIEGRLHLESGNYGLAEGPLRQALERFRALKRPVNAAQVLANLGRLYTLSQRLKEFEGLDHEFRPLLQAKATRKWISELREQVARWAEEAGISLPPTSEVIAKIDDDPETLIH